MTEGNAWGRLPYFVMMHKNAINVKSRWKDMFINLLIT